MEEDTTTAVCGVGIPGFQQCIGQLEAVAGPQCMNDDSETKMSFFSFNKSDTNFNGVKPPMSYPDIKHAGLKGSTIILLNLPKIMLDNDKQNVPAVSVSNSQNASHLEMPSLEPYDTATSTSHSASAVNYPLREASQQPPLILWEDQARPNYGDLGKSERPAFRFRPSLIPTIADGSSSYLDETHKPQPPHDRVPVNDKYDYHFYHAGCEMALNRMDQWEGLSPVLKLS